MSRRVIAAVVVVAIIAVAAGAIATKGPGKSAGSATQSETTTQTGQGAKGLTFSPASYDSVGIADFFTKAVEAGNVVEWSGDWQQLGGGGGPALVAEQASQHGMEMMAVVQFFSQSTGDLLRPLNSSNEQHYLDITSSFVRQYKPAYFGIGIEVNVLYEKNTTSFDQFVSFYPQVYDEVKALSPGTVVFTIFQYERLNGLDGGLYGGTNDPGKAEWQLLTLFPELDVVAFTTYPSLIYQSPSDVPSDYYSRISSHTDKAVGFTEVGWHSGYVPGGWGGNVSEQSSFVTRFFGLTAGLNRVFLVWSFMYDQNTIMPFNTMGLYFVNGTAKASWQTWLDAH